MCLFFAGRVLELSTMATSLTQAAHDNLNCPICLSFFKEPKNLTCSHTFCKGCLETLLESRGNQDVLLCPTCRAETSVPGGDVSTLQSNITVRSLVEDVETQGHSNSNKEGNSMQIKWSKCKKHPDSIEEFFCIDCNKYFCPKCGMVEHRVHTFLETGEHETELTNNVKELASKADAKIREVDNYALFVVDQRKRVHNVQKQRKDAIDESFKESVQNLKERKTVLEEEVEHGQLEKLETSLGDMEKSSREQIDQIKKDLEFVKNGLNFPLETEALDSHKAKFQQLEELLYQIEPNEELPRQIAEEGEGICFRPQGLDGLQLGQLRQHESKWVLRTEEPLPVDDCMTGMAISPKNEIAVGCYMGGIVIYSSEGIVQDTVLKAVQVHALHFMPDGGYVISDNNNRGRGTWRDNWRGGWKGKRGRGRRMFLYTELCEKLDVTFETMNDEYSGDGGLTVGKDGLIFVGYNVCKQIQVFKPEGGKAIREITCDGFEPGQMFAMTSSHAIVVKGGCRKVHVIDDESGAINHSISKVDENPYPAVYQDDSVIIAWVKHDQGLLSIVQYTKELKHIKNILTDFRIKRELNPMCYLQAFKTGEIAFCTRNRLYIFHETWE